MTTSNSITVTTSRKIMWVGAVLLAASAVECGGTTQSAFGTAPSAVSALAAAPDAAGTFGMLKEGKGKDSTGKGPDRGGETPTAGTTPTTGGTPDSDGPETGDKGHGHAPEPGDDHGHATTQIEGFTTSIAGTCPALTIEINGLTVTTDATTDFQRADCAALAPATPPPTGTTPTAGTTPTTGTTPTAGTEPTAPAASFHLHIAATADATGKLVASYVRMQGGDDTGDDGDDTTPPPPTGTTATR